MKTSALMILITLIGLNTHVEEPKKVKSGFGLFADQGVKLKNHDTRVLNRIEVKITLENSLKYDYDFSQLKDKIISQQTIKDIVESCTPHVYSNTKSINLNKFIISIWSERSKVKSAQYSSETLIGEDYKKCILDGLNKQVISK